jgi:SAM-dependent methyltransferase
MEDQPTTKSAPSRAEALEAAWREYYRRASEPPARPQARDAMHHDLEGALARLIPNDASVLEAGCAEGDLLASLPNSVRHGIDYLPEVVAAARARHPELSFEVGDVTARPGAPALTSADAASLGDARRFDAVVCDRLCHSVLDVQGLLLGLKRRLSADGRIYLTAFNYLWELPTRMAELGGL